MKLQKLTSISNVPRKRRIYEDACGTAHGLELVGERWALLVLRELMLGPKRFNDLRADLPGISANVLTQRLEGLEANGLLMKRRLPPPSSAQVYELTDWGYEIDPVIQALGRWAIRSPGHDPTLPVSAVSLMLSFRALIDPEAAGDFNARIGFRMGAESYLARLADGGIEIARDLLDDADAIFIGAPPAIAAAIYDGQPLETLEAAGMLEVKGDRSLAERFVTFFPLPPKFEKPGN